MERLSSGPVRPLRLLGLHGHGGHASQVCGNLEKFFAVASGGAGGSAAAPLVELRCIEAPYLETSRRANGRQWWRYDEGGMGNRPDDWAEMEVAATRLAEELHAAPEPYDGLVGFSQGAEMVHTMALLGHRGDPRVLSERAPRFIVSLSGAVNEGHYESPGAGGPPRGCMGPRHGPRSGELETPCLFVADFGKDDWYAQRRFKETIDLYMDATIVGHDLNHRVPAALDPSSAATIRRFLSRFS